MTLTTTDRLLDCRVTLSTEVPVEMKLTPDMRPQTALHMQYSFRYKDRWLYDLRKTSTGASRELACQNRPFFPVELEFSPDPQGDAQLQAESLLAKTGDLLFRVAARGSPTAGKRPPLTFRVRKQWTNPSL